MADPRTTAMRADPGLNGWLVVDKPRGLSSSRVVQMIRRITGRKAGHAGTLDPLATGVLPVAVGEATKMTAYAMAGQKRYRFRIRWGVGRDTDDCEGEIVGESPLRPRREEIETVLPRFLGTIQQVPPVYCALKVNGRRAYALARKSAPPRLAPRPVEIAEIRLVGMLDPDHADCEALVGKGTYIRALARDIGEALGTLAHVADLRRLSVGRFTENQAIPLDFIAAGQHISEESGRLLPLESVLDGIPAVILSEAEAGRLRSGQSVTPADPEWAGHCPLDRGVVVGAWHNEALVALARVENRALRPIRVINR
jgi:tRNA pseudouridine55 synthase